MVRRNQNGEFVCCAIIQSTAKWETHVVEAKAIHEGIIVVKEMGLSRVVIESDCLWVVQALQKGEMEPSDFHMILEDIIVLVISLSLLCDILLRGRGTKSLMS